MTIGPLVLELFQRVSSAYGKREAFDAAWKNHTKSKAIWRYECHVGQRVIKEWLEEEKIDVFVNTALKGAGNGDGVVKNGSAISHIISEDGRIFEGRYYVDATYEGDLMAASGVSYKVGRESIAEFNESFAGIQYNTTFSQLTVPVDPYVEEGNPQSGLIPTVQDQALGKAGDR